MSATTEVPADLDAPIPFRTGSFSPSVTAVIGDLATPLSDEEKYLIRWLEGFGGEATHRDAQQRCAPNLSGLQIKNAASTLASGGLMVVEDSGSGKSKKSVYRLTELGCQAVRLMKNDPNQMTLF